MLLITRSRGQQRASARERAFTRVRSARLSTRLLGESAREVLRSGGSDLCIPVNELDRTEHPMHATAQDLTDLDDDLRLVTLPEAARFLCVSRGTLYDLLTSGQLPSVHIGRARRVPLGELRRFVRERLERDTLQVP
jgi:excisionase family DNA binding protein